MGLFGQLNLNYLRIFMSVYRSGSMTHAAKELHLTQSGISQQIKSLESALGVVLFDRINRKIIPTSNAELLYKECAKHFEELELVLEQISSEEQSLTGRIKIGFPPVFGDHVLIPLIAEWSKKNPNVQFELRMGLTSEMTQKLLEGKLDFAFISSFTRDPKVASEVVATEYLELCCQKELLDQRRGNPDNPDYFRKLPYVAYVQGEPMLRSWFQSTFQIIPQDFNIVATVIDSTAVASIIQEGMAAGLLPDTLVKRLQRDDPEIHVFDVGERLATTICACYLSKKTLSRPASQCLEFLRQALVERSK